MGGQLDDMRSVAMDDSREWAGVGIRGPGSQRGGIWRGRGRGCDLGEMESMSIAFCGLTIKVKFSKWYDRRCFCECCARKELGCVEIRHLIERENREI